MAVDRSPVARAFLIKKMNIKSGARTHSGLWLIASMFAGVAFAGQPDGGDLDEIVVSATRLETSVRDVARSISVVDAGRIQDATQQLSLDEVLAGIPGLYMQNRYNFSQDLRVSLRGFGARSSFGIRGIRIFVDGIPETLPDGQAQVDSIDIGSAEHIEVLRGPASSLYGNASGGVIAIRTELGNTSPFAEARLAAGDFGFRQYQLKTGGELSRLDFLLNLSRKEIDGYREHSRAEGDLINGKFGLDITEKDRLIVSLNYIDQPIALDPGGIGAVQAENDPASARARNVLFNAGEKISQQRAGFLYRHDGDGSELMIRNYYVWRDFSNRLPFTSGGAIDLERFFYGAGVQYNANALQDDALNWTIGFDADRQDDRRQRYDNNAGTIGNLVFDQNENVDSTGVFLHGQYRWSDSWSLRGGLRYDRVSFDVRDRFLANGDDSGAKDFRELSSSFAINYEFTGGVMFASFSTSFDTPTTTELANPDGSGGFNELLVAQTAANYELGFKRSAKAFYYEVAAFHISLDDELVPFELAAFPGRTFFANAGKSSRHGIEAVARWQGESGLRAELSYTWSDFTFDEFLDDNGNDFAGKRLPGLPQHFAYASLSYDSEKNIYGTFEINYSGNLYANNANDVSVPSYVVGNIRFGYRGRAGRWRVEPYVGINNIFDESYNSNIRINAFGGRFFEPAPVRNYYAGIIMRFE
jgi:iron complex outermembrane recepter protein